tara:strand:+ start:37694 stop:37978 length:285 start_codon:yes stop_codon:yes gene_type:complete
MQIMRFVLSIILTAALGIPAFAGTLDVVRKNDALTCGVSQGLPGFSAPDGKGNWIGIDADFCRAVAAVVLGSPGKVKFRPLSTKEAMRLQQKYG